MEKPYVVSEDIYLLLRHWANHKNFVLPEEDFFRNLRSEFAIFFQEIFLNLEMVSEQEMIIGIESIVKKSELTPISIDRSYYSSKYNFDITRFIDINKNSVGIGARHGAPNIHIQLHKLRNKLKGKSVIIVDDVIFFGDATERTIKELSRLGINVLAVCAGIGIKNGVDKLNRSGYEVRCVRNYESVIDEVCERDFYPGVPLSGRSVIGEDNIGAPYILPFGDPGEWASIPKKWQKPLSKFCINQTIKLFEAIEKESGRIIKCEDLDRKVLYLPTNGECYIDCLREIMKKI